MADAYAAARANEENLDEPISFRRHAAQPYDDRIFRFLPGADQVSIWTLAGRLKVPLVCGDRQRALLAYHKGEVDLMLVRGGWYVAVASILGGAWIAYDPAQVEFGKANSATV